MKQYIVDAFTNELFHGNQAAVCVMEQWLDEQLMMDIALENRFSETAFMVKEEQGYHLRWFTPGGEIDLCGHATLATAFIVFRYYEPEAEKIVFQTLSGQLTVQKEENLLVMNFPAYVLTNVSVTDEMEEAIGVRPVEAYMGRDLLCVLPTAEDVAQADPDLEKVKKLPGLLCHITAEGIYGFDCVSRSFAPKLDVEEDPVCGSGHCHIVPYWAKRLRQKDILAYQASERGGILHCRMKRDRVDLAGEAVLFSVSDIYVN